MILQSLPVQVRSPGFWLVCRDRPYHRTDGLRPLERKPPVSLSLCAQRVQRRPPGQLRGAWSAQAVEQHCDGAPPLLRARTHADALRLRESHLNETPRDVDARLLYGLVLSWEGRYDEARPALQQVLTQAPTYADARVALMNLEYWSGHSAAASIPVVVAPASARTRADSRLPPRTANSYGVRVPKLGW